MKRMMGFSSLSLVKMRADTHLRFLTNKALRMSVCLLIETDVALTDSLLVPIYRHDSSLTLGQEM